MRNLRIGSIALLTGLVAMVLALSACVPIQPPAGNGSGPSAGESTGEVITMYVGPERVDCVGVAPMKCLQVRYAPDEEWQWFYGGIDGFFFVPGFNYELLVNRFPIENPPADGSSIGYSLVEVVSMTPAYTGEALPLVGTEWLLVSFGEEQIVQYDPQLTPVTALFADDGTVSGKGGCNQYTGTYTEADGTLTFGPLASTMMMCDDAAMAVETAYFAALDGTHDYTINGNMLQIVYAAGQLTYQGATVTE